MTHEEAFRLLHELAEDGWVGQRISLHDGRWYVTLSHPMDPGAKPGDMFWHPKIVQGGPNMRVEASIEEAVHLAGRNR